MAAGPLPSEELDLDFLLHPDPPSPSVFLDLLPPTYLDDDDMVLPYISHLLTEEEDAHAESFFYQYPDHPALLHARQPFADILADAAAASSSSGATGTSPSSFCSVDTTDDQQQGQGQGTSDSDHWRDANADMATSAFLKGMEEATKFLPSILPTNTTTLLLHDARGRKNRDDDGDGDGDPESRRATKLMLPAETTDEADARRMFDELMIHERDDICMKGVQQQGLLAASTDDTDSTQKPTRRRRRRGSADGDGPVDLQSCTRCCSGGGYGTTYFSTRFREALFYYSAQFDLLDATVPRDSPERLLLERDIFGRAAMNVVACEGADRVERPETYRQWQARNQRAGLRQLPLEPAVVKVVMDKVKDNYHRDFVVDEDQGWLLHRWKGRVLYGLSSWVADQ